MVELIGECSGLVGSVNQYGFWLMRIGVDLFEERSLGTWAGWAREITCAAH
jgi:hypothetical protein